jgi:hypothetical protein
LFPFASVLNLGGCLNFHSDYVGWTVAMNLYNDQTIDSSGESLCCYELYIS